MVARKRPFWLGLLDFYKKSFGDCLVPRNYKTADGFRLGFWVSAQRTAYSKDQLAPERLHLLEDLGFVWNTYVAQWEQGFSELTTFKSEHKHCLVQRGYKTASGYQLGSWVSTQRAAYNKDQVTPERLQRLDELGFVWGQQSEVWEQGFSAIAVYKDGYKDCLVVQGYKTASGYDLGRWVSNQRALFNKDKLTPERIQRLDDLGFVWDVLTEQWERGFSELTIFKNSNNACRVYAQDKTPTGFALGVWVSTQRTAYKKGQLTPERIQRLEALGFIWDRLAERWEKGFSELATYKRGYQDCLVPATYKTASGYKLGSWSSQQRVAYNKGQLTSERIRRLDDLGFAWKVR